jgi:fluoride exporter
MTWLLVAIGGAGGATTRYLGDTLVTRRLGQYLPWGTLLINLLGSAVFGLLIGRSSSGDLSASWLALLGTGFCGAFTTASTLAWEVVALAEAKATRRSAGYLALTVTLGLLCGAAGVALGSSA